MFTNNVSVLFTSLGLRYVPTPRYLLHLQRRDSHEDKYVNSGKRLPSCSRQKHHGQCRRVALLLKAKTYIKQNRVEWDGMNALQRNTALTELFKVEDACLNFDMGLNRSRSLPRKDLYNDANLKDSEQKYLLTKGERHSEESRQHLGIVPSRNKNFQMHSEIQSIPAATFRF